MRACATGRASMSAVRPIAIDGPLVSIRKFAERAFTMERLVEVGTLTQPMVDVLAAAVAGKISTIISGGTGSGKTTMLNALSNYIPQPRTSHHHRGCGGAPAAAAACRPAGDPPGQYRGQRRGHARDLVRNALRMRPDRIIVGECRGEEAFDMLQAMNTGHEGSMTTIHANSPRDALKRLEQMVGMAGMPMTLSSIRSQIASAVTLVVQVQRLPDGARRVTSVSEIVGMDGDAIQMNEIFQFAKEFTDSSGRIHGAFRATGIRPEFLADLKAYGIEIPASHFDFEPRPLSYAVSAPGVIYCLVILAVVFAVVSLHRLAAELRSTKRSIKRWLALSVSADANSQLHDALRQERGLADLDNSRLSGLNDLLIQTGLKPTKLALRCGPS